MMLNWKEDTLLGHHARVEILMIPGGDAVRVDARVRGGALTVGFVQYSAACADLIEGSCPFDVPLEGFFSDDRRAMLEFEKWLDRVFNCKKLTVVEKDL